MSSEQAKEKKRGQQAATAWLVQASADQKVSVAGCDFKYGETLNDLIAEKIAVPSSTDRDFSWGFFKQVKGHVTHAVHFSGRRQDGGKNPSAAIQTAKEERPRPQR